MILIPTYKNQIKERCRLRGFVAKGYYYAKYIGDRYWGLLSVNYAKYTEGGRISIGLGIYNEDISKIQNALSQSSDAKALPWLLLINIGWLDPVKPHYESWYVDADSDISAVCNSIFDRIDDLAPNFYNNYSSVDSLLRLYENYRAQPWPIPHDTVFRVLPCLYLASHQKQKGLEYILQYISNQVLVSQYNIHLVQKYDSWSEAPLLLDFHPGDVFSLLTESGQLRFFQFVSNDSSEFDSNVIRVFKRDYPINSNPSISLIINDDIECYMHTFVNWGVYLKLWSFYGNNPDVGNKDIPFRHSKDFGRFALFKKIVSNDWVVWIMNQPKQSVGALPKAFHSSAIGDIASPSMVIKRVNGGIFPSEWYPLFSNN